ncbi:desulfoferrodoxin [Patescibacteria group bacterium]|nr:desulfoferrodoxin [Patescibacteria group bacterium]
MTELKQVYLCEVCGNVVEVVGKGFGELVCCKQPMKLQQPRNQDEGLEKHVPVVEKTETGLKVQVGEIPHPMEENHFIQWIELVIEDIVYRQHLKSGQAPEVEFALKPEKYIVREYCNLHGLWQTEK